MFAVEAKDFEQLLVELLGERETEMLLSLFLTSFFPKKMSG